MRAVLLALLLGGCLAAPGLAPSPAAGDVHVKALKVETKLGAFTAILFENETPATAAFMEKLVGAKYYDGRAFGRVIPGFVIQEVDRTGGTTDQPERVKGEFGTNVTFSAGAFGIARDADPDSGGSEFFVMDYATSTLYGNYTAFAQVVDGMDVVHAIARVPAVRTGPASSVVGSPPGSPVAFGVHDRVPVEPVVMQRVTIVDAALPADVAARYPLRVAPSVTTPTARYTLEWPRDVAAGRASALAWYVAARGGDGTQDPPQPDMTGATVAIGGQTLRPTEGPPGLLAFSWTPPAPGAFDIALVRGGETLARGEVVVS